MYGRKKLKKGKDTLRARGIHLKNDKDNQKTIVFCGEFDKDSEHWGGGSENRAKNKDILILC